MEKALLEVEVNSEPDGDAIQVELTLWNGESVYHWFKISTLRPLPQGDSNQ
jgi:hypothetical protein